MTDLLQQELTGAPVTVTIAGAEYPISYGMAAVIVYKAETARIERSRPRAADSDPLCLCGERKSSHAGASLIILDNDGKLACWAFRLYDPAQGDSLLTPGSWKRIDLDQDPERWLACLWAGLHQLSKDGTKWEAPLSLAALGSKIPVGAGARALSLKMIEALQSSAERPRKADTSPNAAAPELVRKGPPAPPHPVMSTESTGSTPAQDVASNLPAQTS